MQTNTGKFGPAERASPAWRLPLARVLVVAAGVSLLPSALAVDNWQVDGANGVLHVVGEMTESACRLDMNSTWQEVNLGSIPTGKLQNVGDRGTPAKVTLTLQDCLPGPSLIQGQRKGNSVWSNSQPAVVVSFTAQADDNNPELVKVQGAGGVGLRLSDALGNDVRLGSSGTPLLLTPGENQLVYTIAPERTRAPLQVGSYQARIDFRLDYD